MLILNKSLDDLMTKSFQRLSGTPITETSSGGIARLLLAIVNEHLAGEEGFYKVLDINHAQAFLSSATGVNLELIGQLLNCVKNKNEEDNEYRYRISKQTLVLASANKTAVRLAALSVDGVKDVIMKPFTYGTGSFSIFVISDSVNPGDALLSAVSNAVEEVKGYGIRHEIFMPALIPIEFKAKLIFVKEADELTKKSVIAQVLQAVKNYINSRMPGEEIVINEVNEIVMRTSELIYDYQVTDFRVNNRPALLTNQKSKWNQRFVESSKPGAIEIR